MEKEIFASRGNRLTIGIFGCCNVGKSSLINSLTRQDVSLVSELPGTTTDVNIKTMELLPLGPITIVDTPGIDDKSYIGELRIKKAEEYIDKVDMAIVLLDASISNLLNKYEKDLVYKLKKAKIPYIIVANKIDLVKNSQIKEEGILPISVVNSLGIDQLINLIIKLGLKLTNKEKNLISDLDINLSKDDIVILVTPIDESAPKGRLILPQVKTIRTLLDNHCITIIYQEGELQILLEKINEKPSLIITDSQVFEKVSKIVPFDIPLTSFSILFANIRGILNESKNAIERLNELKANDKVLICEGCTHHRQCQDIGTVKIPKWLMEKTNTVINFDFISGGKYPENIDSYSLIIHCGGCMATKKEIENFSKKAKKHNIPFINYGILIAYLNGCLERAIMVFK